LWSSRNLTESGIPESESVSVAASIVLRRSCQNRLKGSDYSCVELGPNPFGDPNPRDMRRHGVAVRSIGSHRVVSVCNRDDPGNERDLRVLQPVRVATTVDSFVMVADDSRYLRVVVNVEQDPLTNDWMVFHHASLGQREGSWLLQKAGWQSDLPDVMH